MIPTSDIDPMRAPPGAAPAGKAGQSAPAANAMPAARIASFADQLLNMQEDESAADVTVDAAEQTAFLIGSGESILRPETAATPGLAPTPEADTDTPAEALEAPLPSDTGLIPLAAAPDTAPMHAASAPDGRLTEAPETQLQIAQTVAVAGDPDASAETSDGPDPTTLPHPEPASTDAIAPARDVTRDAALPVDHPDQAAPPTPSQILSQGTVNAAQGPASPAPGAAASSVSSPSPAPSHQAPPPAAPVIVAPPASVPDILGNALKSIDDQPDRIIVQLDPPELGRISLDFQFDDAQLRHITVSADTPEAMRRLRLMHFELSQSLETRGLSGHDLSFRQGQGSGAQGDPGQRPGPTTPQGAFTDGDWPSGAADRTTPLQPSPRQALLPGRLDIKV